MVLVGVLVGMAGVALLMGGGHATDAAAQLGGRASPLGRVALLAASLSWVVGSLWSRRLPLPASVALASAMEMLVASPLLFLAAGLRGEWTTFHPGAVTGAGWGALGYLIVFGSLAGFGSYLFLLVNEGPARASTNAFVNPLIAVALGRVGRGAGGAADLRGGRDDRGGGRRRDPRELGLAAGQPGVVVKRESTKPTGVRLIMGYKLGKAIVQTLAGIVLVYGATHGLAAVLTTFADHLREHAVHAWSNVVAAALLRFTSGRHSIWRRPPRCSATRC